MEKSASQAALILELHLAKAEFDRAYSAILASIADRESDTVLERLITETQGFERKLADIADKRETGVCDETGDKSEKRLG